MLDQQKVCEDVKEGVQRLMAGKMDRKEFDEFVKTNDAKLDALAAEKKRKADEDWFRYSLTFL